MENPAKWSHSARPSTSYWDNMIIDHYMTEQPVCPYCGKEQNFHDEGCSTREDCEQCGQEFNVERDYAVYYITSKIEREDKG